VSIVEIASSSKEIDDTIVGVNANVFDGRFFRRRWLFDDRFLRQCWLFDDGFLRQCWLFEDGFLR